MAPITIAARILVFLATHPEDVEAVIKGAQSIFGELPGSERFAVVAGTIKEAIDFDDPDDKAWEKALRIAKPFIDRLVAKVKGKVIAAAA